MLKTMRNNLKSLSWVLWIVILTFVGFIFIQWGAGELNLQGEKNDIVSVGGTVIKADDFRLYLTKGLDSYRNQMKENFNKAFIRQLGIPEQILQNLVNSTIIAKEAKKLHLSVSDEELKKSIVAFSAFQQGGKFIGVEEYERLLAYNQVKVSEFEADMRNSLMAGKLKELVAGWVVAETKELREEYQKENDKADIEFISFKPESVKEEVSPTETEIRQYYEKNKNSYKTPEKRGGYVLRFKLDDYKKEVKLTEKDLYDYYKANKDMFRVSGKTKVRRIFVKYGEKNREEVLKKIEGLAVGIDNDHFSEKAREISEDEKAKEGGDWGYWGWQNFSSPEQTVIEKLEGGGVSTPIDTGTGFSIVNVSEKIPEKQENYEEVKSRIKSTIETSRLKEIAAGKAGKIYNQIKGETNLKVAAQRKGFNVTETPPVANGEPIKGVDEMGYLSQKFFSSRKDEITSPVEMPDGLAILQLRLIEKPGIETFEQARESVKTELATQKKLDQLMAKAQRIYSQADKLKEAQKVDEYLKKENLKLESHEYRRGNRISYLPVYKGLDDLIFSMSDGQMMQPLRLKTEIILLRLKSKKMTTDQDFARESKAFYQKKADDLKNSLFASYLLRKRTEYDIRVNVPLFEKVKDSVLSQSR